MAPSFSNLQSLTEAVRSFVQAINKGNQTLGQILRNIKPNVLIGNSSTSDGTLQAIGLDGTLQFSGQNLGLQTGLKTYTASHTLAAGDYGFRIEMNVGTTNTLTVPSDTSENFAIGSAFSIVEVGAGQTQFVPDTGVTILSASGGTHIAWQYGQAQIYKRAANIWVLSGDIS